jgi:hypothetical protein
MMKGICLIISMSLCLAAYGQRSEVGFGIGTFNYTGDLAKNYDFRNSRPAATLFYRSNISKVISFRIGATAGKLAGSDKRPEDAFAAERNAAFNIFLFEASGVMEYHFLNWRDEKIMYRYSPYLFAGLGLFGMSGNQSKPEQYSNVQGAIPFGLGIKYIVNPKWYVAAEFGARKTFFDYLDNVSAGDGRTKNYQYGNPNDNDSYYFLGFSVTRTFYVIPCPTNPYK